MYSVSLSTAIKKSLILLDTQGIYINKYLAAIKRAGDKMDTTSIIGYIAGILTTLAFVPQVIRTWKTKSARDISLVMCIALFLGICLWMIYGIILKSMPVIAANAAVFILVLILLSLKIRYR